jgi:hypothetical protein
MFSASDVSRAVERVAAQWGADPPWPCVIAFIRAGQRLLTMSSVASAGEKHERGGSSENTPAEDGPLAIICGRKPAVCRRRRARRGVAVSCFAIRVQIRTVAGYPHHWAAVGQTRMVLVCQPGRLPRGVSSAAAPGNLANKPDFRDPPRLLPHL